MRGPTQGASIDRAIWPHPSLIQSLIRTRGLGIVRSCRRTRLVSFRLIESHENALYISDSGLFDFARAPDTGVGSGSKSVQTRIV